MLFKCLFMLTILVLSGSVVEMSTDCATSSFTIKSAYNGYVYYYGYYGNLNLLAFSTSTSYFCFTKNNALKEVGSKMCVGTSYGQLVLVNNCNLQWVYDSKTQYLVASGLCLSPWNYLNVKPDSVTTVPGLSQCSGYNRMVLNPNPPEYCFDDNRVDYVKCTYQTGTNPSACDCGDKTECYIKLEITKNSQRGDNNYEYSINSGRIGPTIIINHEAILAVDVINNIDEGTSIHYHGMHQINMPWMDGVGNITQYQIPANGGKFRYILRAHPSGTHWYHSHVGLQRDKGIFGALIAKEKPGVINKLSEFSGYTNRRMNDDPKLHVVAVTEHMKKSDDNHRGCNQDGSPVPVNNLYVDSFQMNGVKLEQNVNGYRQEPSFIVDTSRNTRFRVIGATEETVIRISVDFHIMRVIATDGYLTEPYDIDYLHVHAGERYDFTLWPRPDTGDRSVFAIRIESVAVYCKNHDQPERVGIAYLKHSGSAVLRKVEDGRCVRNCISLNCPFGQYPLAATNVPHYICYDVYNALRLLHPTPKDELPENTLPWYSPGITKFINHEWDGVMRVNDIRFKFPNTPFAVNGDSRVPDECPYSTTRNCDKQCPHTVKLGREYNSKTVKFVLSSVRGGPRKPPDQIIPKILTHPIHMHGHSFWVTKIAYPTYSSDAKIVRDNDDVTVPACGYGNWKYGRPPWPGINVNNRTIRKDTIIVPAGGYVVVEINVGGNPGSWLMHCHIDHHLEEGMGIVIREMTECQNQPPPELMKPTNEFCISVKEFKRREKIKRCSLNTMAADEELPNELKKDELEDINPFNHEDNDEPAYYKMKKSLFGFQNERGGPLDGESREWFKKK